MDEAYRADSLYVYLQDGSKPQDFIEQIEDEQENKISGTINYAKNIEISQSMYSKLVTLIIVIIFILTILIAVSYTHLRAHET